MRDKTQTGQWSRVVKEVLTVDCDLGCTLGTLRHQAIDELSKVAFNIRVDTTLVPY